MCFSVVTGTFVIPETYSVRNVVPSASSNKKCRLKSSGSRKAPVSAVSPARPSWKSPRRRFAARRDPGRRYVCRWAFRLKNAHYLMCLTRPLGFVWYLKHTAAPLSSIDYFVRRTGARFFSPARRALIIQRVLPNYFGRADFAEGSADDYFTPFATERRLFLG